MRDFLRLGPPLMLSVLLSACRAGTEAPPSGTQSPGSAASSEDADPRTDEALPSASFCGAGPDAAYDRVARTIFDALQPDAATAYLALRQNVGGIPSPGLSEELRDVAERGQRCSDATDVEACVNAYEALRPDIRVGFQHCYTRGDVAACVESVADAVALLGQVSSIDEAFFVAEYAGYSVSCSPSDVAARGKQLADGSYRLVLGKRRAGGPCGQLHRAVVDVQPDGTVEELESTLVDENPSCP